MLGAPDLTSRLVTLRFLLVLARPLPGPITPPSQFFLDTPGVGFAILCNGTALRKKLAPGLPAASFLCFGPASAKVAAANLVFVPFVLLFTNARHILFA